MLQAYQYLLLLLFYEKLYNWIAGLVNEVFEFVTEVMYNVSLKGKPYNFCKKLIGLQAH